MRNATSSRSIRHLWRESLGLAAVGLLVVCAAACGSDDETEDTGTQNCPIGYERNPLTGQCEPATDDAGPSNDAAPDGDDQPTDDSGMDDDDPDIGPDGGGKCADGVDVDGDGLDGKCECDTTKTDPETADSDGDGISDGDELGGACGFIAGQDTNPLQSDTDGDGLDDGKEKQAGTDPINPDSDGDGIEDGIEESTCTDPNSTDTDGDGLPDGVEDSNNDGKIGNCSNRNFSTSCADGESDPCKKDTNGDGTSDGQDARYRKCLPKDKNNLTSPKVIKNQSAKYKLGLESNVKTAQVSSSSGSINAHVFADTNHDYTGFILEYNPNGTTNPRTLAGNISSDVRAQYTKPSSSSSYATVRSTGRGLTTHDGYDSIVEAAVEIPHYSGSSSNIPAPKPHVARDDILAKLAGISKSNLQHNLGATFSRASNAPTLFRYEVLSRSSNRAIVVGALATLPNYEDDTAETGFRVDDLTGGAAVAEPGESLTAECTSFDVDAKSKVDIIISLDGSGSMSQEQNQLSNFASNFTQLLNQSNVDWRVGVSSVQCSDIKNDSNLSQQFRSNWPSPTFGNPATCPSPPFGGVQGTKNGELVGGGFTTKASDISTRLQNVSSTNNEFALTMGIAAVDRALPRKKNSKTNIRKDASVVIVTVTDEIDTWFESKLSGLHNKKNLSSSERSKVANTAKPWVNYLQNNTVKGSKLNATVFGLYWPPGQSCSSAAQVAHGSAEIVSQTGGSGGSVCQPNVSTTLKNVANASAGIGSGLRLLGVPVPPTIEVKHADISAGSSGTVNQVTRSRKNGFDYNSYVNRISFNGPNPPENGDRLIVPYMRWKDSVKQCTKKGDSCPNKKQCVSGICR